MNITRKDMSMNSLSFRCIAAAVALSSANAYAAVIDFEDLSPQFFSNNGVVSQGFNVVHSGSFAYIFGTGGQGGTDFSGNGTNRLLSFNTSTITLSQVGSPAFSLSAFDGGESWVNEPHGWATKIQVVGYYAAGGTTTQLFDLDLFKNPTTGMQTFALSGNFTALNKVEFTGLGGNPEFSLDNFMVNARVAAPVPEPETYGMMMAGLGLVGFMTRRRKQQQASA